MEATRDDQFERWMAELRCLFASAEQSFIEAPCWREYFDLGYTPLAAFKDDLDELGELVGLAPKKPGRDMRLSWRRSDAS